MDRDTMELTATIHREDDHCWAEVDQLSGCFATGELVEAVSEAISLYLADQAPTAAPVATQVARLGIRVDADPIRA